MTRKRCKPIKVIHKLREAGINPAAGCTAPKKGSRKIQGLAGPTGLQNLSAALQGWCPQTPTTPTNRDEWSRDSLQRPIMFLQDILHGPKKLLGEKMIPVQHNATLSHYKGVPQCRGQAITTKGHIVLSSKVNQISFWKVVCQYHSTAAP